MEVPKQITILRVPRQERVMTLRQLKTMEHILIPMMKLAYNNEMSYSNFMMKEKKDLPNKNKNIWKHNEVVC